MLWAGTGIKTRLMQRAYLWTHERREDGAARYAPHGVEVRVDDRADLALRHLLARGGAYEEEEALLIRRHLARGTPVVELGGCLGIVSALIRDVIGPDAPHVVVEANPRIAPLALENAARAAAPGATTLLRAAVDYSGAATVRFAAGANQHAGRVARGAEPGFEAPTTTLSAVVDRLGAERFALVCDIEGAERDLVRHEAAVLGRCDLAVIETHPQAYSAADLRDIDARLLAAGLHRVEAIADVVAYARA